MRSPIQIVKEVACELFGHDPDIGFEDRTILFLQCRRCKGGTRINFVVDDDFYDVHGFEPPSETIPD